MCGRFTIDPAAKEMRAILAALGPQAPLVKTGDVYPGDAAPVLVAATEGMAVRAMSWGFPRWDKRGVVFNARAETALVKPMFRTALRNHPVVIPTTGFYEWKAIPGSRKKEKYRFRRNGEEVLYLAGFAEALEVPREGVSHCFTILTTEANASMAPYHDRMPVLLAREERKAWLTGQEREAFLQRVPFALEAEKSAS